MEDVLSYHVYTTRDGGLWLSDDEQHWTKRFLSSAAFTSAAFAKDIAERKEQTGDTIYILACMGS